MDKFDLCVRVAQVLATFFAAGVAIWVGHSWRRTLRNKSVDECLAAIYDVIDLMDRCFSIPAEEGANRGRAYDEAWNSWRKANGLWEVVRRYDCQLPQHYLNKLADILLKAKPLLKQSCDDDPQVKEVCNAARAFRTRAEEQLPSPQSTLPGRR